MRKGEKLMEWFARTSIGRAEVIAGMSKDEITRRVAIADEQNREDGTEALRKAFEPIKIPARFAVD